MKKLLVKIKVIDIPYSPAIPAQPEKWVKEIDGEMVAVDTQPMIEVDGVMAHDESYTYIPAIPEIPEQVEVSHEEIISQTQGNDDELAVWLAGDAFKYPAGYWVEYVDITAELEDHKALEAAKLEIQKGMDALAVFKVRVKQKGLTNTQLAQLFNNTEINKIIATLSTGSIGLSVALINNYVADGVLVTEEDKLAVLAALGN